SSFELIWDRPPFQLFASRGPVQTCAPFLQRRRSSQSQWQRLAAPGEPRLQPAIRRRTDTRPARLFDLQTQSFRLGATQKFLLVTVALVLQILMNADLGRVVAIDRQRLDGAEEALFQSLLGSGLEL